MKTLLIMLAALAISARPALAQAPGSAGPAAVATPPTPAQLAERRTEHLTKALGLTADQQARLQPILLAQRQDMLALRNQRPAGGRRRGMGQDLKAAQANYDGQIQAVLTPEQLIRYNQLKDEQRTRLQERRTNGPGPALPE